MQEFEEQEAKEQASDAAQRSRQSLESSSKSVPAASRTLSADGHADPCNGHSHSRPGADAASKTAPVTVTLPADDQHLRVLGEPTTPPGPPATKCDFCGKKSQAGTLARCSRCKSAHYCNHKCQRQAWPKHKKECKLLKQQQQPAATAATGSAGPAAPAPSGDTAEPSAADVMTSLRTYMSHHATSKEDPLEQQFETGVLQFVQADYRGALTSLQATHGRAVEAGKLALAGDCLRWLGHAHSRLSDGTRAASCFAQGCELAVKIGNKKLQVSHRQSRPGLAQLNKYSKLQKVCCYMLPPYCCTLLHVC